MVYADLPARLAAVRETIARHQAARGWTHPVTIVGVTKTHPPEAIRAAYAAGLVAIGENKVQEALPKQDALQDLPIAWHLVGALQSNKARKVVGRFALLHAVDRENLAGELARRMPDGSSQAVLVEVNCSGEPQKGGVAPEGLPALLDVLAAWPALSVRGLMTMAPFTGDVEVQRATFQSLRTLRDAMERQGHALPELSMGMSGDFGVAVEEGATMVRIGTLLFGERA